MNKQQHLRWCRTRALEYLDMGDLRNACGSLLSDLRKHEDTADAAVIAGQQWAMLAIIGHWDNADNVREFIDQYCPEAK